MLQRIVLPNDPDLNQLHNWIQHLVCEVWCKATTGSNVKDLLEGGLKKMYEKYDWLKNPIDDIFSDCAKMIDVDKANINEAFNRNNEIERLCNNEIEPITLIQLPEVVEKKMKPFFEVLYEKLLDRVLAPVSKMDFYKKIQKENNFTNCPCCGYMPFECESSKNREALDHFFPKAHFPFASINFYNLSPLCYKCNSDNKKDDNPIKKKDGTLRAVFYPYQKTPPNISIDVILSIDFIDLIQEILVNDKKFPINSNQIKIGLTGTEREKIETWNTLFNIKNRYFDRTQGFTYSVLRQLHKKTRKGVSYHEAIDNFIYEIEDELYISEHFLKIPFLKALQPQMRDL